MPEIMLSVAMTTYNHEKYIARALDSILMQKVNFPYEIIVGEDCSGDKTADIVREYAKKYPDIIKPIFQEKNTGGKINAMAVKENCRGKYIAFLEGDDFWTDPLKLQKQVDFLEANPEYTGVVHRYYVVNEAGERTKVRTFGEYKKGGRYTLDDFMKTEIPSQLATFVIRNIYKEIYADGYKKCKEYELRKNTIQGDIRLSFYLVALGDVYRMEDVMSAYRFVDGGGNNWTSKQRKNPQFYNKWLQITDFEDYVKREWGINLRMNCHRRMYSARAILNVLKNPCKQSVSDMKMILKKEKRAILYLFSYVIRKYILRV